MESVFNAQLNLTVKTLRVESQKSMSAAEGLQLLFLASLCTTGKRWKQVQNPQMEEHVNKTWYTHTKF